MGQFNLAEHFLHYFEVVPVRDENARRAVFRLRYAVYCEELHFEDGATFPDGEERDEFDPHSHFALLRHRETGTSAGCVRLITNHSNPNLEFPFEKVCRGRFHLDRYNPETVNRDRIGEISRLAVHSNFRRRRGEASTPEGTSEPTAYFGGERHYPLVAMGLFLSASALALNQGLERALVMMEPRLARLLGSCGILFTQVGDVIDYHGRRGPFQITGEELHDTLRAESRPLLEHLRDVLG